MTDPKRSILLAVLGSTLAFCAVPVRGADEAANTSTNSTAFATELRREALPGLPPATRAYLNAGTNRFAFLVPPGFRLDASAGTSIVLNSPDYASLITLRVREPQSVKTADELKKIGRRWLLKEHPGAVIQSEFSRTVDGQSGPAFDLRCRIAGGAPESVRAVFIPSSVGVLEFQLVCSPARFRKASYRFNGMLLSFCASHGGKLDIVPLSNKL
jgi:hypothetical protein